LRGAHAVKVPTHPDSTRVSAQEVRLVLRHAREHTATQWAEFFQVSVQSIKAWKAKGMLLDRWSAPSSEQWRALKAEAVRDLWQRLTLLEG
jgi:hypothetical protein